MGEMVVVRMGDYDEVDDGKVFDVAGWLGVSFWAHPREGTTPVFEDGVK